ncbi:isochorismatase family protein [Neisseria shayeganii]|uniref:Isochorismatase family protein n=1 Tax=Neisseria shayeganii TaxID=607712 RepID=A0A7D7N6R8_9NEIS|nr:isochorismatase family protein [Neisseria shayeganii]QMT41480.1 isochorismatase family protein [Neisseria shayeganii]
MKTALLVIDVQNEYFAGGAFPQENATEVAQKIAAHIQQAQADGQFVIGVQHVSPEGEALFARGSHGGALHASVSDLLVDKPLVQKMHADCFLGTNLTEILMQQGIEALDICGIMTQNCVTHTALSPAAEAYRIRILGDLCAAPSALVHQIALRALADRVEVI